MDMPVGRDHLPLSDLALSLCQWVSIVTRKDTAIPVDFADDLDIEVQVNLGEARKTTYFYLRALQTDGAIIYASPVFVKVRPCCVSTSG